MEKRVVPSRGGRAGLPLVVLLLLASPGLGQDIGFRGPSLAGAGPSVGSPSVTESKPESKLWFHGGRWWGSLWSSAALAFHIHRLDAATHAWIDTGVAVESRPDSHSDALWDGSKLYIASHEYGTGAGSPGEPLLLLRYGYSAASDVFTLDPGFPVTIGDCTSEILVIDKDSTGTLWAVWKQDSRVYFAHSLGSDELWSAPAMLPGSTSDFDTDDICSVIHFDGRIGVLWSDQVQESFFFSTHLDGAPDTEWSPVELALAESDDHIHLEADSAGRVYAVVKNRADEIKLLVRDTGGLWQQFLVSAASDGWSRPIVLLDEEARLIHAFGKVGPLIAGGSIHHKSSSMDTLAFAPGAGTIVIQDGSGAPINNPTSTKQNLTAETGMVVLAANVSTAGHYWHHEVPGEPPGNGLVLDVSPAVAGVQNEFTVKGATPGAVVGFYSSLKPGTSTVTRPQCPAGIVVDLGAPFRLFGTARVDPSGSATLRYVPPPTTAGKLFLFQAVEPASCRASNRVDKRMASP
jgi:hypothetical protein